MDEPMRSRLFARLASVLAEQRQLHPDVDFDLSQPHIDELEAILDSCLAAIPTAAREGPPAVQALIQDTGKQLRELNRRCEESLLAADERESIAELLATAARAAGADHAVSVVAKVISRLGPRKPGIDLRRENRLVKEFLAQNRDPRAAWQAWCAALQTRFPKATAIHRRLARVDVARDVARVARELRSITSADPPPVDVDTLWFGLYDMIDWLWRERAGFDVGGAADFPRLGHDALVRQIWRPENRHLAAPWLQVVKSCEPWARKRPLEELNVCLSYSGMLLAAALLVRAAATEVGAGRTLVVGFDSGDVLIVSGPSADPPAPTAGH